MNILLVIIYVSVIMTMAVGMTVVMLKGKKAAYNHSYMAFSTMIILWSLSQLLILNSKSTGALLISYTIGNTGICFTGPLWFSFALLYSGYRNKKPEIIAMAIGLVNYIIVLTNPFTKLYYLYFEIGKITYGPGFYINMCTTYVFMIVGSVILFKYMGSKTVKNTVTGNVNTRTPQIMIFMAAFIPLVLNVLYHSGIAKTKYDITPVGFGVSSILLLLATIRYRFLDVEMKRELEISNVALLLEKERNRIAQQVHDTAGHTLTMVQSYMKLVDSAVLNEDYEDAHELLSEGRALTSKGIREIRESINELREEAEHELVTQGIVQLRNTSHEIPIELTIQGEDSRKYSHLSRIVYDSVRESITNTMKYASATKIDIFLNFQKDALDVIIGDDGKGVDKIVENNGTRGIRERVEKAGGTVRFISAEGEGFMTRIHIPLFEI